MSEHDDLGFFRRPQLTRLTDGTWLGAYPLEDWSVTADTREKTIELLRAENIRRDQSDPETINRRFEKMYAHLNDPIPGLYPIRHSDLEGLSEDEKKTKLDSIADEIDASRSQ